MQHLERHVGRVLGEPDLVEQQHGPTSPGSCCAWYAHALANCVSIAPDVESGEHWYGKMYTAGCARQNASAPPPGQVARDDLQRERLAVRLADDEDGHAVEDARDDDEHVLAQRVVARDARLEAHAVEVQVLLGLERADGSRRERARRRAGGCGAAAVAASARASVAVARRREPVVVHVREAGGTTRSVSSCAASAASRPPRRRARRARPRTAAPPADAAAPARARGAAAAPRRVLGEAEERGTLPRARRLLARAALAAALAAAAAARASAAARRAARRGAASAPANCAAAAPEGEKGLSFIPDETNCAAARLRGTARRGALHVAQAHALVALGAPHVRLRDEEELDEQAARARRARGRRRPSS